ncbi:hypothetical protein JAAARDRAFT_51446 [Jaapia argillacea MUCL 33604]|uniref:Uncharacterized protein n=1 Tax=Jaapia argillacea MUCL 33604 TaxID=933084 RepID=A0A067P8B2_9AGAM|nr:hypothetical protein JAAARDRAFT_51446 [Jaapia argillacea MUCL 33604]
MGKAQHHLKVELESSSPPLTAGNTISRNGRVTGIPHICDMIFNFLPFLNISREELMTARPMYWDTIVLAYKILRLVNKQWSEYLKKFTYSSIIFGFPLRRYKGIVFQQPTRGWQLHVLHLRIHNERGDADVQKRQFLCVGDMLELRTLVLGGSKSRVESALATIPFPQLVKLHSVTIVTSALDIKYGGLCLAQGLKKLSIVLHYRDQESLETHYQAGFSDLPLHRLARLSISDYNSTMDHSHKIFDKPLNSLLKSISGCNIARGMTSLSLKEIWVWGPFLQLLEGMPALTALAVEQNSMLTDRFSVVDSVLIPGLTFLRAFPRLAETLVGSRPISILEIVTACNYSESRELSLARLLDLLPIGLTSLKYPTTVGVAEETLRGIVKRCPLLKQIEIDLSFGTIFGHAQEGWMDPLFKALTAHTSGICSLKVLGFAAQLSIDAEALEDHVKALMTLRTSLSLVYIAPRMWRSMDGKTQRMMMPREMMEVAWALNCASNTACDTVSLSKGVKGIKGVKKEYLDAELHPPPPCKSRRRITPDHSKGGTEGWDVLLSRGVTPSGRKASVALFDFPGVGITSSYDAFSISCFLSWPRLTT